MVNAWDAQNKMLFMIWDMLYFVYFYERSYIFFSASFHFSVAWNCHGYGKYCRNQINQCYYWKCNATAEYSFYQKFSLPTELFLIYPILIWSSSRSLDIIWANIFHKLLSNAWELKVGYQQNLLVWKKLFFFLAKAFPSSFAVNVRKVKS